MFNYLWLVLLLLQSVLSQTIDDDRPYKFGFNIQGYQHRQEEKDEKGLIRGEYGFITADGYYRITVYATDENGDFRIISMKNYYVGFPPEDPTTTPGSPSDPAGQPRTFAGIPPDAAGRALPLNDLTKMTPRPFTLSQGIAACSDCSIPTTTQRINQARVDSGEFRSGRTGKGNFGSTLTRGPPRQLPVFPEAKGNVQTSPGQDSQFPQAQLPGQTPASPQAAQRTGARFSSTGENPKSFFGSPQQHNGPEQSKPVNEAFGSHDSGSPRSRNDFIQINRLDDTSRGRPQIGEAREGLPRGVTVNDIKDLLYTFNYTVGFHGHHEDGYKNGDKQGDYFFDGRDGIERKVEYFANDFGYQPNITLINLSENDVRRPNEKKEKEYGLKGYEFKWFYRK